MSYPPDSQYGQGYGGQSSGAGGQYGQGSYGGSYGTTQPAYQQSGYQQSGYQQQGTAGYSSAGGSYAPAPTSKPTRPWLAPVVAVATFLAGLGIGVLARGDSTPPVPSALPAATVTATATAPPETVEATVTVAKPTTAPTTAQGTDKKTRIVRDGLWKIGTDIMPGTYISLVPSTSPGCYVAFLSSSNKKDVIKDVQADAGEDVKVAVPSPSLAPYFYSKDCGLWVLLEE